MCQAERPSQKRLLVPAAASLPYQAVLAKAYLLQLLNAVFATFEVEVLVAVALANVAETAAVAAAEEQVAAAVFAELGQLMLTAAEVGTAEVLGLVVPVAVMTWPVAA